MAAGAGAWGPGLGPGFRERRFVSFFFFEKLWVGDEVGEAGGAVTEVFAEVFFEEKCELVGGCWREGVVLMLGWLESCVGIG